MKMLVTVFAMLTVASIAQAAPLSNDMTCAQAKSYASQYGRILTMTGNGDVLPIYGFSRSCPRASDSSAVMVRTLDSGRCVIGFHCLHHGR